MSKNISNNFLKKISVRKLKSDKSTNLFILSAIILTTILFTVITTLSISLKDSLDFQKFTLEGYTAHGIIKNVTSTDLEKIHNDPSIKNIGEMIQVTNKIENPEFENSNLVLCYLDDETLSKRVYYDLNGNLPSAENEIALPTWVLDKFHLPYKLGQVINLQYTCNNQHKSTDFTLSAYYTEYTKSSTTENGFGIVSKDFKDNKGEISLDLYITFNTGVNIIDNFEKIRSDLNLNNKQVEVNSACTTTSTLTFDELLPYISMIITIIICGYLIIYNIFYISVLKNIKFYGLLKSLGTTKKQIKKIIRYQYLRLSIIGIPLGIIIGYLICFVVSPLVIKSVNISKLNIKFNPLIFISTIIFVLFTIIISCKKPIKIASKVSPIEALKYSPNSKRKNTTKAGTNGAKIYKMAFQNLFRDKTKSIIVILSLTFGFICFICAGVLANSLNPDAYLDTYVPYDFKVENTYLQRINTNEENPITYDDTKVFNEISALDNIKDVNKISYFSAPLEYDGVLKSNSDEFRKKAGGNPFESKVNSNILGVNEHFFDNISDLLIDGDIDISKLKSHNYAIVSNVSNNAIKVGDTMNIGTKDNPKQVEVIAVLKRNTYTHVFQNGPDIMIDDSLLKELYPEAKPFILTFSLKDDNAKETYEKLKDITTGFPYINIKAKHLERNNFVKSQRGIAFTLISISSLMSFIGLVNFINTIITNISSRKIELAILESIGMTKKQIRKMLTFEGIYYGIFSLLLVSTFGSILAYYLVEAFKYQANYASFNFPIIQLIVTGIVIIITCVLTPKIIFHFYSKSSIIERLKNIN
ncbi:ABC transporter permease [Clostridium cibarium]|uniref:ABC transporter permease n=1 Tax=Clostridium cibarium TaxID=2762247 RepID=A0ABR8PWH8_9CLOT|nr:FtsX-like permease family protein [Clostridium cibarium]MBD7912494.1 ABC transporter permease [Clostridium cibarium]